MASRDRRMDRKTAVRPRVWKPMLVRNLPPAWLHEETPGKTHSQSQHSLGRRGCPTDSYDVAREGLGQKPSLP